MTQNNPNSSIPQRLLSLDAYRGAVMLLLAVNAFGLAALAKATDNPLLDWLGFQASHPQWISQFHLIGFALWDMIQPAFMFIVGVAVPYSFAKRQLLGQCRWQILCHSWNRSALLVLLGVFLTSAHASETNWIFTNVLCQIGLGYSFLALLAGRSYRAQLLTGVMILAASWLIYALYPISAPAAAAADDARILPGFFGHWSFNRNAGWAFDRWFLNLFPRSKPFAGHTGGYVTINFIPAFVTMLMGLMCGQLLRDERISPPEKLKRFALGGAACLLAGALMSLTICPVVKRLWTPSWTLFSGAYVIWSLALFYWMIDLRGWKGWTLPLVVAGMNPLAIYVMDSLSKNWVVGQLHIHLPGFLFAKPWGCVVDAALAALLFWLVCYWMYRRKIFLRF